MTYRSYKSLRPLRLECFNLRTLGLVGTIFLPGCLHRFSTEMDRWVGKSESDLVSSLGAPNLTAAIADGKVLTYLTPWQTDEGKQECRRSFTISTAGRVTKWSASNCPPIYRGR